MPLFEDDLDLAPPGELRATVRLPAPPKFSGKLEDWDDWSYTFTAYMSASDSRFTEILRIASLQENRIVDSDAGTDPGLLRLLKVLHYTLVQLCNGSAKVICRNNLGLNVA